jgi:hypothetical protein
MEYSKQSAIFIILTFDAPRVLSCPQPVKENPAKPKLNRALRTVRGVRFGFVFTSNLGGIPIDLVAAALPHRHAPRQRHPRQVQIRPPNDFGFHCAWPRIMMRPATK